MIRSRPIINYDHALNKHTLTGARASLPYIFERRCPKSLLDVGCGVGTWVRAAIEYGVSEVCGIDGIQLSDEALLFPAAFFRQQDLTQAWDLSRKFDIALCLEVGEHLAPEAAASLVRCLTAHSDVVAFSGACPGQIGQHHVNCQWPEYWQRLFNAEGYACYDSIRWQIWSIEAIEPWYRQNIFVACRAPNEAGHEQRIKPVIHPQMLALKAFDVFEEEWRRRLDLIESGHKSTKWYLATAFNAYRGKWKRKAGKRIGLFRWDLP